MVLLFFWLRQKETKRERKNHINKEMLERGKGGKRRHTQQQRQAKKEKIIHFDLNAQSDAFALLLPSLCADFIDYMKRIQIAAQECNIRFLNPIVGTPEKPPHVHIFFYYSFLVQFFSASFLSLTLSLTLPPRPWRPLLFRWFLLEYKKATIGKEGATKSLFFLPKLNMEFFFFLCSHLTHFLHSSLSTSN
jgi:hypothetical protein